jgi:predicted metalloprotease
MHVRVFAVALALATVVMPAAVSAQSTVETVVGDIDAFWAQQFADLGLAYVSPQLQAVSEAMDTPCGTIAPAYSPGAYCAANQTVYYSTAWAPDAPGAEILWWTVLSHEWGHHIQWQTDTGVTTGLDAELQADCFAGAYMRHAEDAGLVDPTAVTLALQLTQSAGDVPFLLPADAPEHGNKAQRALAFMNGMNEGVTGCGFTG